MAYVVTKNNPYYPDVFYCETMLDAVTKRKELVEEMTSLDGRHVCKITIAHIVETVEVRCDY